MWTFYANQSFDLQCPLKGYSSQREIHSIYLHLYNVLVVRSNCAKRSLISMNCSVIVPETLHDGFRALPSWDLCASDINRLRHWRMHVRTSYVWPKLFDVSSTSRNAYITITIISKDSANSCLFQQCASDVNDLAYVTGVQVSRWQRSESK